MSSSPDPVAALGDAWRRARQSLSFTSVRGREATSTHHLHIGGYSTVNKLYEQGKGMESKPFRAGGYRWTLTYYPNGWRNSNTGGSPCVGLSLLQKPFSLRVATAMAGYTVSILDHDGNLLCSHCVEPQHYRSWRSNGIVHVPFTEETKAALRRLKDDSLVVRCDLAVLSSEQESKLRWLLRRFLD